MKDRMHDTEVNINYRKTVRFSRGEVGQRKRERESNCPLDKRFTNTKSMVGV